jgi:molybdopterin converting factor small subunit
VRVGVPSQLRSYTAHAPEVEAEGTTLDALFTDLDRRFPGFRFRVINEQDQFREHIKVFVNQEKTTALDTPLRPQDRVLLLCAISGG